LLEEEQVIKEKKTVSWYQLQGSTEEIEALNKAIYKHLHCCSSVGYCVSRIESNKRGRPGEEKVRRRTSQRLWQ
jgi:predicted transcriptional regulator